MCAMVCKTLGSTDLRFEHFRPTLWNQEMIGESFIKKAKLNSRFIKPRHGQDK